MDRHNSFLKKSLQHFRFCCFGLSLMVCRTVYSTERICHTGGIFGSNMSHVWYIRSNTAHPPAEYWTQNVPYSIGFSFSMLTKTYLSLTKNAHKNWKKTYISHVYFQINLKKTPNKSSSCALCRPKTLTFIITFFDFLMYCLHNWPQQPLVQDLRVHYFKLDYHPLWPSRSRSDI